MPQQAGNSPMGWWQTDDEPHALVPGDVLRAHEAEADDPYALVKVTAIHRVREVEEAVVTPLLTFGQNVSAPIMGEGGLLRAYEVLSADEAAELLPAPDTASSLTTDVASGRALLAKARAEAA